MPQKKFLVNRSQNQKYRIDGLLRSTHLPNKDRLRREFTSHVLYSAESLPNKVDLRPYMTPVEDQSQIGSCSANCLAGAFEYLAKKHSGQNTRVSRLFIYYNGRVKENKSSTVTDSGCSMTDGIEALEESGVCLESQWKYDISKVNDRPDDQAYQAAKPHKITEALQVQVDLNEMKSCLAQGFPFALGLRLFSSFDQASSNGVVPMPDSSDAGRSSDGSHALLAVGYSDKSQSFIVRNSWGEKWGDKGYCYIPYNYVGDSQYCFDVWTVRKESGDDFGKDHWDDDDSTDYRDTNDGDGDDDDRAIEQYSSGSDSEGQSDQEDDN